MLNEVNNGRCTIEQVVQWMCSKPAEVWHIQNKGRIQTGYDADLTLIDMERIHEVRDDNQVTKSQWTPWHGVTLKGKPIRTWVNASEAYSDNDGVETFCTSTFGSRARFRDEPLK